MTFNYRLDRETFICGGPTNNGGFVLKWYAESFLRRKLTAASDYQLLIDDLKLTPPGSEGLIFLPYILGERAPIWNSNACGVFFGIGEHHRQEHFTRAVIEGISMALYSIGENMEKVGLSLSQINVSGGFVHATQWLQILADMFGKKVCLINTGDGSALGAAYLGMKKTGMIKSYSEMESKDVKEILPQMEQFEAYQKQYKVFKNLWESLEKYVGNE
jgi:gluconokinase